jgi:hypothetical protein
VKVAGRGLRSSSDEVLVFIKMDINLFCMLIYGYHPYGTARSRRGRGNIIHDFICPKHYRTKDINNKLAGRFLDPNSNQVLVTLHFNLSYPLS